MGKKKKPVQQWDSDLALEVALDVGKLLEQKYFKDVCVALMQEDETEFNKICNNAKVVTGDVQLRHQVYVMLQAGIATNTMNVWP